MKYTFIYMEEIDSTNLEAGRLADEIFHGTVLVAERQTAGRGRRGRSWLSESEENLYFSLLLKPTFAPEQASMLTLLMAQAVAEAIDEVCGCDCRIKWPNDIVLNDKKVCGILTEMKPGANGIQHVIVGVGVNVNQTAFVGEGLLYAGSLRGELGIEVNRDKLLDGILEHFNGLYEAFCQSGSLKPMQEEYEAKLANLGKEVKVLDPKGEYQGIALGINDKGELLVQKADGTVEEVYAGEVSVRGLWGYV